MSLTELQEAILVRLIGKPDEAEIVCKYPGWLEKRMAEHRAWVRAQFSDPALAMKKLTHAQFYAEGEGKREQESERHQRVSAQVAGR